MLTSKQRSKLRAMANSLESSYHIGKEGVSPQIITELYKLLEARELVKIAINSNSGLDAKEAIQLICEKTGAEPISAIGSKVVIFKPSRKKPKIDITSI